MSAMCPITDIKFVLTSDLDTYTANGYHTVAAFNETTTLIYSTTTNNLPITSTAVQYQPCMNPGEQSDFPGKSFYKPEMQRDGCTEEANSQLLYDPRYSSIGLYTNQADVYNENGVMDLLTTQPKYSSLGGPTASTMQGYLYQGWNRPTLSWSLQCEADNITR